MALTVQKKGQAFGQVAKEYLSGLIFGDSIEVHLKGIDRYDRTLGIVFFQGLNVNEKMLKEGMAWHYSKYDNNPLWQKYADAARQQKKGLWAQANPIPPWEWRHPSQ